MRESVWCIAGLAGGRPQLTCTPPLRREILARDHPENLPRGSLGPVAPTDRPIERERSPMKRCLLTLAALPAAYAGGTATLFSSDLASGPALDNVKATWDADLALPSWAGDKARLSLLCAPLLV